jgi:hypothetical protein
MRLRKTIPALQSYVSSFLLLFVPVTHCFSSAWVRVSLASPVNAVSYNLRSPWLIHRSQGAVLPMNEGVVLCPKPCPSEFTFGSLVKRPSPLGVASAASFLPALVRTLPSASVQSLG